MNKSFVFSAVFLPLVALISAVQASDIPRYDVKGYCKSVADTSGGSAMIMQGCLEMEQDAYNILKDNWNDIDPAILGYCDEVAQVSGESYSIFQGCVELEMSSAQKSEGFEFEY